MARTKQNPASSDEKLIAVLAPAGVGALALSSDADTATAKALPVRIKMLNWGVNATAKGEVVVNETTVAVLGENQRATKRERVALDFQHATEKATAKDEPLAVAGWGQVEVVAGDGLYLSGVTYTDQGNEFLKGGHYPDVSAVVKLNARNEVIWVPSAGAVRHGAAGMPLIPLGSPEIDAALPLLKLMAGDSDSETATDYKALAIGLLQSMGADTLTEYSTDAEVAAAAETLKENQAKKPNPEDKPETGNQELETENLTAMSAEATALTKVEDRLKALEANQESILRQGIVAQASREGKVIPLSAEEIDETPVKLLESIVAKLPASQVPGAGDPLALAAQRGGTALNPGQGLSAEDRQVCQLLGIEEADFAKANGIKLTGQN